MSCAYQFGIASCVSSWKKWVNKARGLIAGAGIASSWHCRCQTELEFGEFPSLMMYRHQKLTGYRRWDDQLEQSARGQWKKERKVGSVRTLWSFYY